MRGLLLATSNVRKLYRSLACWYEIKDVVPVNSIRDYTDVMPADQLMERFLEAIINTWWLLGTLLSASANQSRLWLQTGLCSNL